jgi:hypothetical protein
MAQAFFDVYERLEERTRVLPYSPAARGSR